MKAKIAREIIDLNHQFYQSFARDFSETRERLQMGVVEILGRIPPDCSLLDLGCGNGNLILGLAENGFQGNYLGVDFSLALLDQAPLHEPIDFEVEFKELDLTSPSWEETLPPNPYHVICCFATLHHIPGQELRARVCRNIRRHIREDGRVYLSVWQFIRSRRLRKKIIPWQTVGVQDDQVDEGDYLLDWQRGGSGTRYVHLFSAYELGSLALEAGFRVIDTFDSDGAGGNLGMYQVWEPV